MSAGNPDEKDVHIARLEVKVDSILQILKEGNERTQNNLNDHESRIRATEKAGDVHARLNALEDRMSSTERWIHALPVGLVITFIVAVGGLVSYVGGLPT